MAKKKQREIGAALAFGANRQHQTVWLDPRCQFNGAPSECYCDGQDYFINSKLSRRAVMENAASCIAESWMSELRRAADTKWTWLCRPYVRVGTRRFHLKLTAHAVERGFAVDPSACRIVIEAGTKAQVCDRTCRAVQQAWEAWLGDTIHDAIYKPKPKQHEALPAAEQDGLRIDFEVCMARIARESAATSSNTEVRS